jgi:hypothetical protein
MKHLFLLIIAMSAAAGNSLACTVCKTQQPKALQGITHGAGPGDNWDYLIVSIAAALVLFTLAFSIKFIAQPGEKNPDHVKHRILNLQTYE